MTELSERDPAERATAMTFEYVRHVPMLVTDANAICEETDTVYDFAVQSTRVGEADLLALRIAMHAASLVHTIAYQIWDETRETQGFSPASLEWLRTASHVVEELDHRIVNDGHANRPIWADPA